MFEETLALIDEVSRPAEKMAGAVESLGGAVRGLDSGGLEGANASLAEMGGGLSELAPIALGAAGAIAGLGLALGGLILEGSKLALEQSELRNQLVATFDVLGRGRTSGGETVAMIEEMRGELGMTRAQLVPFAKDLMSVGFAGDALKAQLTAVASVKAFAGDKGARAYTNTLTRLAEGVKVSSKQLLELQKAGIPVDEIAKQLGQRSFKDLSKALDQGRVSSKAFQAALTGAVTASGAKALELQANSLSNQWAIFKENLADLFSGVNAEGFFGSMKDLLGIFGQGTASGKTMKAAITGFFNGVFTIASKVLPYLKRFFLDLVIAGLKIYIALKPSIVAMKEMFASKGAGDALGATLKFIEGGIVMTGYAIAGAIMFFTRLMTIGKAVVGAISDAFSSIGDIATRLIDGLVGGIKGGVTKVVDAAKGLAGGAMNAIKGALGISSPSRVMMQFGAHTAGGFAAGLDQSAPTVREASYRMSDAATSGASSPAAVGGSASSAASPSAGSTSGHSVTFEAGSIVINGAGKDAEGITEVMIATVFERLALTQGLA